MLARELSRPLRVLIASQPTRGLDVGSIEFVHKRIVRERDRGTAVIIVSTELDEVLALADRIAVMYRGRVVAIVPGDTGRDVLGLMAQGRTNSAIGKALYVSDGAVEKHVTSIFTKLDPSVVARAIEQYRLHDVTAGTTGSAGGEA